MLLSTLLLVLQEAAGSGTAAPVPASRPPSSFFGGTDLLLIPLALIVTFYFIAWRPQARERKKREAMFTGLKKNDRVLLSCGLVAQVAALTEQDVLVKFDDKDPRRLRFRKYAIQGVLGAEETPAAEPVEVAAK